MKMVANIYRCRGCRRLLLGEDLQGHACKDMEDYKFEADGSILSVFAGGRWYPLKWLKKPPTDLQHHQRSDQQRKETPDKDNNTIDNINTT